jgi:hypothetical protein
MNADRNEAYLAGLLHELRKLPNETEWVEFKANYADPQEIGEYISALSNAAALCGLEFNRVGSYKKKLKDFPEKERALWRIFDFWA